VLSVILEDVTLVESKIHKNDIKWWFKVVHAGVRKGVGSGQIPSQICQVCILKIENDVEMLVSMLANGDKRGHPSTVGKRCRAERHQLIRRQA
jgi:hypothetical protein